MTKTELKKAVRRVGQAVERLPQEKRMYILGYADGVNDAMDKQDRKEGS